MIRYSGINHLAMATSDMDRTIRYWRDLLGMKLVTAMGKPGYRHYFFQVTPLDRIAFFEWPGVEPLKEKDHGRPVKGPFVFDHVALGVEDEDELWKIKDRLEAAGFWVSEVVDHGIVHSIYSFDPNGIPVEFSIEPEGLDLEANPIMADEQPSDIAKEGFDPVPGHWPEVSRPTPKQERSSYPGVGSELFQGKKKF